MEEYYVPKGQNHKKDPPSPPQSTPPPKKKNVDKAAAADLVNVGDRAHVAQTSLAYQLTGKRSAANGCGVC